MEFDYKQTLELLKGGLMDHRGTWTKYLDSKPSWQHTAIVLTGPMIITSVLLGLVFSRIMGGFVYYGYGMGFFPALLTGLVTAALGIVIAAFVLSLLAGVFAGKQSFSRAFAAISLAGIPGFLAGIVAALVPGVGALISLAGGIVSLVFLYKIIPLALDVPDNKRALHFVVSLVVIIITNMILSYALGFGNVRRDYGGFDSTGRSNGEITGDRTVQGSGVFGEFERQSRLMEAASKDVFEPPEDSKLVRNQVEIYVDVMKKTRAAHERYEAQLRKFQEDMEGKEEASISDMTLIGAGMGGALSAQNAEMEIVKTGGGNWAEHNWVKQQLHVAQIQQGTGSDAIEHNHALYEEFADELQ